MAAKVSMAGGTEGSNAEKRTVQSVDRAVAAIELLAGSSQGYSLTTLSKSLNLAPQTLQSLLRTLQVHGWVAQPAARGPYCLGSGLGEIHRRWRRGQDRVSLARPIVADLVQQFGEYTVVAEWTGDGLRPLLEAHPDRQLAVRGESFSRDRLHTMATGKLLLALLDQSYQREVVGSLTLAALGPNSVTDSEVLLNQLKSIRRADVAVCIDEAAEGVVAIAVPVRQSHGKSLAAIGVSLPGARYSRVRRTELTVGLRNAGEAIAQAWA